MKPPSRKLLFGSGPTTWAMDKVSTWPFQGTPVKGGLKKVLPRTFRHELPPRGNLHRGNLPQGNFPPNKARLRLNTRPELRPKPKTMSHSNKNNICNCSNRILTKPRWTIVGFQLGPTVRFYLNSDCVLVGSQLGSSPWPASPPSRNPRPREPRSRKRRLRDDPAKVDID